jgi:hypothetical protein
MILVDMDAFASCQIVLFIELDDETALPCLVGLYAANQIESIFLITKCLSLFDLSKNNNNNK